MESSTTALPGRASIAIREALSIDLAGIIVHEVQHRGEAVQLYLSGACEPTKELVIPADDMLVRSEVRAPIAIMDVSLTVHVEFLDAIPHLI
jgi:hypothetical protein